MGNVKKDFFERDIFFSHGKNDSRVPYRPVHHYHDNYEIYLSRSPELKYLIGNRVYNLPAGGVALLNSFDVHRPLIPEDCDYERHVIVFRREFLTIWNNGEIDLLSLFSNRPPNFNHCRVLEDSQFRALLDLIEKGSRWEGDVSGSGRMMVRLVLMEILLLLHGVYSEREENYSVTENPVSPVLAYIRDNLEEDLVLTELADRNHMTPNTLNNHFKKHMGFTVKQYILHARIQLARELLSSGISVTDTAYRSGFGNLSHFIRIFHEKTGMTPGEVGKMYGHRSKTAAPAR